MDVFVNPLAGAWPVPSGQGQGEGPLAPCVHGGPDALGVPLHDFSTNANACGPCPAALQAVRQADRRHYPDPAYTALRAQLAAFHGVQPERVVLAASASEFIHRISMYAARSGLGQAVLPAHGYGDYARAAQLWGLSLSTVPQVEGPALHWACEPASPVGTEDAALAPWAQHAVAAGGVSAAALYVLDSAYAPLRLHGAPRAWPDAVWRLFSPNKALGLTGVRAAYALAPQGAQAQAAAVQALAPSWPLGADGVAMLSAWAQPAAQQWLQEALHTLRGWKAQQEVLCTGLGWQVLPGSLANYFCARPPVANLPAALAELRGQGIKLRDCASFGLPGHVRLGVLAPAAQQALEQAWARAAAAGGAVPAQA